MRLCKGTTEGPRRVRQLDGAFLFGPERIVANPDITPVSSFVRIGSHPETEGKETIRSRWNSGFTHQISISSQSGSRSNRPCAGILSTGPHKRQLRTIEAANIRIRALFPLVHPSLDRIQTGDVGRQSFDKIVGWNHSLRTIFPHDRVCLVGVRIVSTGKMRTSTFLNS